ncbi:MAG: hypothetical protein PHZ00_08055 [Candidatus Peribacteraceae bacterium]|nr:hypothetical protein [Candidatus Peribacteraceae bacterium]
MNSRAPIHRSLAEGRWQTFSLAFQLANVGSEVGRALKAKQEGRTDRMTAPLDRALELLDLTIADPKHRHRLKELCRLREVLCDFFLGDNDYGSNPDVIDRYFLEFAVAARNERT